MKAGSSQVCITPPPGGDLTGFISREQPSTGVHDDLHARALVPRPVPAGRSSAVREEVDYGFLYGMDAYLSDRPAAGAIEPGQIKRLRVLKSGVQAAEEVLGEVPVESDGSFSMQVPARVPLRLQTLDGDGRVLEEMSSWIWVMPREARGCIGCHEDRELTPPNRQTQALRNLPHLVGVKDRAVVGDDEESAPQRRPGG